jgi:hypothetical protein
MSCSARGSLRAPSPGRRWPPGSRSRPTAGRGEARRRDARGVRVVELGASTESAYSNTSVPTNTAPEGWLIIAIAEWRGLNGVRSHRTATTAVPPKAPLPTEPVRLSVVAATVSTEKSPFIARQRGDAGDADAVAVLQAVARRDGGDDRRGVRAAGDEDAARGGAAGAEASLLDAHVVLLRAEKGPAIPQNKNGSAALPGTPARRPVLKSFARQLAERIVELHAPVHRLVRVSRARRPEVLILTRRHARDANAVFLARPGPLHYRPLRV